MRTSSMEDADVLIDGKPYIIDTLQGLNKLLSKRLRGVVVTEKGRSKRVKWTMEKLKGNAKVAETGGAALLLNDK